MIADWNGIDFWFNLVIIIITQYHTDQTAHIGIYFN